MTGGTQLASPRFTVTDELRLSALLPTASSSNEVHWTLALAGGEGVSLRDYVMQKFGQPIPKQFCRILGERSMLEHTLDRLLTITPAAQTLTVIGADHRGLALPQLRARSHHVLVQPGSRDTGMAAYMALSMIKRWTPNAVVTITPTDHYVEPAERYVAQVRLARGIAARMRDTIVVLGARPTDPDPHLGYLELDEMRIRLPPLHRVRAFVERPTVARAHDLTTLGALWNTRVACGTVEAFWELGRKTQPHLMGILDAMVPLVGTEHEAEAIEYVYRAYCPVNLSAGFLAAAPGRLAVLELDGVQWSDWGRSERIETTLALRRTRREMR